MRLPLKAKICRTLAAGKDGRWKGECRSLKKLNAREPIVSTTKWIMENGQGKLGPGAGSREPGNEASSGSTPAPGSRLPTPRAAPKKRRERQNRRSPWNILEKPEEKWTSLKDVTFIYFSAAPAKRQSQFVWPLRSRLSILTVTADLVRP